MTLPTSNLPPYKVPPSLFSLLNISSLSLALISIILPLVSFPPTINLLPNLAAIADVIKAFSIVNESCKGLYVIF